MPKQINGLYPRGNDTMPERFPVNRGWQKGGRQVLGEESYP